MSRTLVFWFARMQEKVWQPLSYKQQPQWFEGDASQNLSSMEFKGIVFKTDMGIQIPLNLRFFLIIPMTSNLCNTIVKLVKKTIMRLAFKGTARLKTLRKLWPSEKPAT